MSKDSWNHVPKPADRVKRFSLEITRHGRQWYGSYTVELGKLVVVSAYGGRTVMTGRARDLQAKAEKVLAAIVDEALVDERVGRAGAASDSDA